MFNHVSPLPLWFRLNVQVLMVSPGVKKDIGAVVHIWWAWLGAKTS